MGWRQLRLPFYFIITHCTHCLFIVFVLGLHLISICALFFFWLNYRSGGTSEERENMLLREQGMGN